VTNADVTEIRRT